MAHFSGKMVYDPVVKNGRFRVSYQGTEYTFSAVDAAAAKYKFMRKFGLALSPGLLGCEVVKATVRTSHLRRSEG